MLKESDIKKIKHFREKFINPNSIEYAVALAHQVSAMVAKNYRYGCGLAHLEIMTGRTWSYRGVEQPNPKASGFFESPDGQNGEFYYALRDAGFAHHFRMAEYHWGVRMGKIILTYTEGDVDVFEEPVGYKSPKS